MLPDGVVRISQKLLMSDAQHSLEFTENGAKNKKKQNKMLWKIEKHLRMHNTSNMEVDELQYISFT